MSSPVKSPPRKTSARPLASDVDVVSLLEMDVIFTTILIEGTMLSSDPPSARLLSFESDNPC